LRVPWLLDAESGGQINDLEKRAHAAEADVQTLEMEADQSEAIKKENKRLHNLFAEFMEEAESLARELKENPGDNYGAWLQERRNWMEKVGQTLIDMNLPTEAAAFRHAGEKDATIPAPGTVLNRRYWYDFYSGQLDACRTKLQSIVERRLR
jgi:hypothetical protein